MRPQTSTFEQQTSEPAILEVFEEPVSREQLLYGAEVNGLRGPIGPRIERLGATYTKKAEDISYIAGIIEDTGGDHESLIFKDIAIRYYRLGGSVLSWVGVKIPVRMG